MDIYTFVYENLSERLMAVIGKDAIPSPAGKPLVWIDLFNDQENRETEENLLPRPAILIEFTPISWSAEADLVQVGETLIRFHCLRKTLASTAHGTKWKTEGLEILSWLNEIHKALQGWSGNDEFGNEFSSLDRATTELDQDHDNSLDHVLEYATYLRDASASRQARFSAEVSPALCVTKESDIAEPERVSTVIVKVN